LFNRLFPRQVDNAFHGSKLAPWFFALVVLLKIGVSLYAVLNGSVMASSGDGIPIGTLSAENAQTIISLYALWGLAHFMLCLVCLLVLVRYRTLIPFMFVLLLVEHLGRKLVLHFLPLSKNGPVGDSPGISPIPYRPPGPGREARPLGSFCADA